MAFRRGGAGKRRDANEPAIREAIAACGRRSWQLGGLGLPDVLIWSPAPFVRVPPGFWLPVEIKVEGGGFTEHQEPGRFPVARSVEDVLGYLGIR